MNHSTSRPPRRIKNAGYVALNAVDLAKTKDFYVRSCNFVPVFEDSEMVLLRSQFEHHCLALYKSNIGGLRHLAFETMNDADTEQLRDLLKSMNVPVREAPPMPGRMGLAFQFQDPDQNWVEVYNTMQRLPGRVSQGPFQLNHLGHFTMLSPDIHRMKDFYHQIGFRISDSSDRWVFMRTNTDHHSLALFPGKRTGLHHHAYEVEDWNQIKLLLDWMYVQETVPEVGPILHTAGKNVCVYVRDPDDMLIEFYCELEQIYDDEDHIRDYPVKSFNLWLRNTAPEGFHR